VNSDVPVFGGYVAVGGKLTLDFPTQVTAWCRQLAGETGAEVNLLITDRNQEKTRLQEKGFHAMVSPWSRERGWEIDALKQFLLKRIFGTHDFIDFSTGEVVQVLAEAHTSKLTKRQYSDLIERTMEIAAEDGYYLTAPDEYRRIKEAERTKAARLAAKHTDGATSDSATRPRAGTRSGVSAGSLTPS
jgi:hypothetical protein